MALVPSNRLGALSRVQGKSGVGNVYFSLVDIFHSNGKKFLRWYTHQASVNEAPGLLLTVSLMGKLVENKELGRKVAAEGFEGPGLDPSAEGRNAK